MAVPPPVPPSAPKTLGWLDLACLGLNGVIGSGIVASPGFIAHDLGSLGPVAFAVGGLLCLIVALCFAEMAGLYPSTGGAYVYARAVLGRFPGFLVGWTMWLSAVLGWSAVAALLADLLDGGPAAAAATVLVLSGVNALGARPAAGLNNLVTVVKLVGLGAFVLWSVPRLQAQAFVPGHAPPHDLVAGFLMVLYTFSGFEEVPVPAGEVRHPQRAVPVAFVTVIAVATLLYVLIQGAAGSLGLAGQERPLEVAMAGHPGLLSLMTLTGLALVAGVNASIAFTGPRTLWALARDGELPAWLVPLHPTFGSPLRCIVVTGALVAALVLVVPFKTLALLSVMASLLQYIPTLVAMLVLRIREPRRERPFRLPGGEVLALVGLAVCLFLLSQASWWDHACTGAALAVGAALYFVRRV